MVLFLKMYVARFVFVLFACFFFGNAFFSSTRYGYFDAGGDYCEGLADLKMLGVGYGQA